jgi:Flp pilus assembly pilin Flp
MDHVRALVSRVTISALSVRDEERGQGMVEYAVVITLVAMGCVLAFTGLATTISNALGNIKI